MNFNFCFSKVLDEVLKFLRVVVKKVQLDYELLLVVGSEVARQSQALLALNRNKSVKVNLCYLKKRIFEFNFSKRKWPKSDNQFICVCGPMLVSEGEECCVAVRSCRLGWLNNDLDRFWTLDRRGEYRGSAKLALDQKVIIVRV